MPPSTTPPASTPEQALLGALEPAPALPAKPRKIAGKTGRARARTEWLRSLGLHQHTLRAQTGGMFVVSETTVKYHRPAQLDDLLTITAQVQHLGKASAVFAQQAWRGDVGGTLLAEGSIRIGWVNAQTLQPSRMPAAVLQAMVPPAAEPRMA